MTTISIEKVREACGVTKPVIPPHLYQDTRYDKWGNIILANGQRLKGELFSDPSVQKVLEQGNVLSLFTQYVKYPRTHHVPWSPGTTKDDRTMPSPNKLIESCVVVTEKMDGENTTMYADHIHARSVMSGGHPSRNWVKNFWSRLAHDIPKGWRICGENLFAKHSIHYHNLESYFLGFSVWDDKNICLSWDSTCEWFELLGIAQVPELYRGLYNEQLIKELLLDTDTQEGYVIRIINGFPLSQFRYCVGKYVREGHVQTTQHWMRGQAIIRNGLKE
jgi:hypothetical protein